MAVFTERDAPPAWCELLAFERVALRAGVEQRLQPKALRTRVLITDGTLQLAGPGQSVVLKQRQFVDLEDVAGWTIKGVTDDAACVVLSGRWGTEMAGCGLFEVQNVAAPQNKGDPVSYSKCTSLDSHYHDCDEYWIILSGSGKVVVGGHHHEVRAGECVAIGMGHHHDFPEVNEPVRAVFFETTLEGRKRIGHLWEHTHGPAMPKPERI